ncbi:MAG TPA: NAD(P)-dependent oxidoreductase [Ignavibacteria bacterium]|mgnify:CR=1 FL=1|nr:NAD(P)-dependent oxidoreductase [Ignavibacteria bacterium]
MKKVIVTGHNGFIGPHLVRLLKESGYYVKGIDTNYFDDSCKFSDDIKPDEELVKDTRLIEASDLEGAYAICHLAALSNDTMGALNKNLTLDINHNASVNIAELAKRVDVKKYIFAASCSMYGIADGDKALDETADFAPVTTYAISKVNTEKDVKPMGDNNFSVTFLRNATAYGLSPKLRLDLVVNNLVGWAMTTGEIRIMSDGTPWRPLVHAEDIARAFVAVIDAPMQQVNGKSFNVGQNSENFQIKDIARIVGEVIPNCKVVITGEHGGDSRSYRVDFTKIKNELPGFQPKWKLKEAVEEIYKGYQKFGMDNEHFNGRYFIRLKQLEYLIKERKLDNNLFWK